MLQFLHRQNYFQVFFINLINIEENGRPTSLLKNPRKIKYPEIEEEENFQIETLKFKEQIDQDQKVIKDLKDQIDKFEKEKILFLEDSEKL